MHLIINVIKVIETFPRCEWLVINKRQINQWRDVNTFRTFWQKSNNGITTCSSKIYVEIDKKIPLKYFFKYIFKATIITFKNCVFSAHVKWPFLHDGILETTVSKISNRFIRIVHSHNTTASPCIHSQITMSITTREQLKICESEN